MLIENSIKSKPFFVISPPKDDISKIMMNSYNKYGGNSVFILACNITNYYRALSHYNNKGKFGETLNREQLLYATSIIDALYYLGNDLVSFNDLINTVKGAQKGEVYALSFQRSLEDKTSSEIRVLFNTIISLETIMYSFEDNIPTNGYDQFEAICETLLDMESEIITVIKQELSENSSEIFKLAKKSVKKYIKDKSFVDTVNSYK